jgi:hypothetical protein
LKIRLFTTMTSLSAIPFLLNYFIISCSISISWLRLALSFRSQKSDTDSVAAARPSFPAG